LLASVTWNVTRVPIGDAGNPLITPVVGFSVNPLGSLPAVNCHVYGPVPPVAVSVCEYAVPTTPLLSAVVVIVSGVAC
jgi:hypothetical protein